MGYTKEEKAAYMRKWRAEHKERSSEIGKKSYALHKKERLEQKKKYYEEHKEERRIYEAKYNEEHRDEISKRNKAYYEKNKEELKNRSKKYSDEHKEERRAYAVKYRNENIDKIREKDRIRALSSERQKWVEEYKKTPQYRATYLVQAYSQKDRQKNHGKCTLTSEWVLNNIFTQPCYYCGETDWHKLGCDRIDNSKPHTPDNVVCSCWDCNNKRGTMLFDEFVKQQIL